MRPENKSIVVHRSIQLPIEPSISNYPNFKQPRNHVKTRPKWRINTPSLLSLSLPLPIVRNIKGRLGERKIRSRTRSFGECVRRVHIVTNEYFLPAGIQTAHSPLPPLCSPCGSPCQHVQTHSRAGRVCGLGFVAETRVCFSVANVSVGPAPDSVSFLSRFLSRLSLSPFGYQPLIPVLFSQPCTGYLHPYPQCPQGTFSESARKRGAGCRPDCACFLAETRHNAPRTAPQR